MRGGIAVELPQLGRNGDGATLRHGVARVDEDVEQRHFQMRRIDQHVGQPPLQRGHQPDLRAHRIVDQVAEFVDQVVEVDAPRLQPGLARKGQQLPRQFRAPLGRLGRIAQQSVLSFVQVACQHQVDIARDHLQQIVEVMRQPGGQLADRLHLLRLAEGLFGRAPPRHVQLAGEEIDELAMIVEHRRDEHCVPEGRSVALVVQDFQRDRLAPRHRVAQVGDRGAIGVCALQEPAVAADDLAFLITGQVQERLVGEDDGIVVLPRVGQDHRHARHLQRREEDGAALFQPGLGHGRAFPVMAGPVAGRAERCRIGQVAGGLAGCFGHRIVGPLFVHLKPLFRGATTIIHRAFGFLRVRFRMFKMLGIA